MELALQGAHLQFQAKVGEQKVIFILQDPTYLSQIAKKSLDQAVLGMGNQGWQ